MSDEQSKVIWQEGSHRIVEREQDFWMAGARKVRKLRLEIRSLSFSFPGPSHWSYLREVDYLRWPYFQFFSKKEAVAFLRGVADATTR